MIDTRSIPHPGDLWLSRPPYLLIARVIDVDERSEPRVVSYELQDDDGSVLERINHATLDSGWWKAFQPMIPRQG
jgi:hypothetical protein